MRTWEIHKDLSPTERAYVIICQLCETRCSCGPQVQLLWYNILFINLITTSAIHQTHSDGSAAKPNQVGHFSDIPQNLLNSSRYQKETYPIKHIDQSRVDLCCLHKTIFEFQCGIVDDVICVAEKEAKIRIV